MLILKMAKNIQIKISYCAYILCKPLFQCDSNSSSSILVGRYTWNNQI